MSSSSATVSPFTKAVVESMRKLYPEKLADSSFDNTGLLLEAPYRPGHLKNSILLTIDLTKAVADEAIARKDSIIVTYHPIIFRPLKSVTLGNSQQNSLLRLAQEGISVYSPHTAVDAVPGGLNDYLADVITQRSPPFEVLSHDRSVITPVKDTPEFFEKAGYGRIVRFHTPQKLKDLAIRIQRILRLSALSVATPQSVARAERPNIEISSVGICAGSGGSLLNGLDVDLLFTGELSHHEALAAAEQGRCIITTFHSKSEREFLKARMFGVLRSQLRSEISQMHLEGCWDNDMEREFEIDFSTVDRDPFEVVTEENYVSW